VTAILIMKETLIFLMGVNVSSLNKAFMCFCVLSSFWNQLVNSMCFMLSVVRGCQGCKHHCSYNDSFITGSGTPFYCEKRRFFNRASIIGKCSLEFCKNRLNLDLYSNHVHLLF
jgi:hypothetical protein